MNKLFTIGFCLLGYLAPFSKAAQCYSPFCPVTPPRPQSALICEPFIDSLKPFTGACVDFFGDSLEYTDLGNNVTTRDNTPGTICDFVYDPSTVANDTCLYPNATLEIYICSALFTMAELLATLCSDYYTLDTDNLTPLGELQYNYNDNPCSNCRPAPAPQICQLVPNPSSKSECPACESSTSVAPTSTSSVMPSSMSGC